MSLNIKAWLAQPEGLAFQKAAAIKRAEADEALATSNPCDPHGQHVMGQAQGQKQAIDYLTDAEEIEKTLGLRE